MQTNIIAENIDRTWGVEVLSFNDVELEKTKQGISSFATIGTLDVLYFKEYQSFVLYLNDWRFALLKSLPVIASKRTHLAPVSFILLTNDGFYNLNFTSVLHPEALMNFETILQENTRFSFREETISSKQEGLISQGNMGGYSQTSYSQPLMATNLHQVSLQPLSSMDFRSGQMRKRDLIKREFLRVANEVQRDAMKKKKNNINLTEARDYLSLRNTQATQAPSYCFSRQEVELTIKTCESLTQNINPTLLLSGNNLSASKGFMETVKSNVYGVITKLSTKDEPLKNINSSDTKTLDTLNPDKMLRREGAPITDVSTSGVILGQESVSDTLGRQSVEHNQLQATSNLTLMDKVKAKLPFFDKSNEDHQEDHPHVGMRDRIIAKIPFMHHDDHQEDQAHTSIMDKVKASLPVIGKPKVVQESTGIQTDLSKVNTSIINKISTETPVMEHILYPTSVSQNQMNHIQTREVLQTQSQSEPVAYHCGRKRRGRGRKVHAGPVQPEGPQENSNPNMNRNIIGRSMNSQPLKQNNILGTTSHTYGSTNHYQG